MNSTTPDGMVWLSGPGWADLAPVTDETAVVGTVRRTPEPTGMGRGMVVRWTATVRGEVNRARFGSRQDAQRFVERQVQA